MLNLPFQQSPNYYPDITKKDVIVFHGTLGNFKSAKDALTTLVRLDDTGRNIGRASAHLLLSRTTGEAVELVKPQNIAWHAGNISNPKQNFLNVAKRNPDGSFVNPNQYCIGIEFCWGYDSNKNKKIDPEEMRCTDEQLADFDVYLKDLIARGLFQLTGTNIISHSDIADYKTDNLSADIARYYALYHPELLNKPKPPTFTKSLAYGSIGDQVVALQKLLRKLGYFTYPTNTGAFYSITQQALTDFQKSRGLSPSGWVDLVTMRVLNGII